MKEYGGAKIKACRGLFVAALFAAIGVGMPAGAWGQAAALPEGKGKDVVEKACTVCHGTSHFTGSRLSKSDWEYVVSDMIDRGALITEDERKIIVEYLAEHFGPDKPAADHFPKPGTAPPAAALRLGRASSAAKKDPIPH